MYKTDIKYEHNEDITIRDKNKGNSRAEIITEMKISLGESISRLVITDDVKINEVQNGGTEFIQITHVYD